MGNYKQKTHYYGLDLLRALSLAGVFFFHLNEDKVPYGYLGVIGFLGLAGFLAVMSVRERENIGNYFLTAGQSVSKRITKLYPPLILMLLPLSVMMIFIFPSFIDHFSYQLRSAILSVNNLWQILNGDSYFQGSGYLKPLTHLWALSLEFQYYLLAALSLDALYRKKHRWIWFSAFAILAVLSFSTLYLLFDPASDPTRVYYGPDTRFFSFALGAMTGLLYPDKPYKNQSKNVLDTIGWLLCIPAVFAFIAPIPPDLMIQLGLGAYSILFAILIFLFSAGGKLSVYVGHSFLIQWLVTRSYWIYLWHFPVFKISERLLAVSDLPGYAYYSIQVISSLLISELAYRLEKGFKSNVRQRKNTARTVRRVKRKNDLKLLLVSAIAMVLFILPWLKIYVWSGGSEFAKLEAKISEQEAQISIKQSEKQAQATLKNIESLPSPSKTEVSTSLPVKSESKNSPILKLPPQRELNSDEQYVLSAVLQNIEAYNGYGGDYFINMDDYRKYRYIPVTMIGDSVSVIASYHIDPYLPSIYLDALSNRQTDDLPAVYEQIKKDGMLGEILVIALGTNGDIDRASIEHVLSEWGDKPVLLFSIVLPYPQQEAERNAVLREIAETYPQVRMVEWNKNTKGIADFYQEDLIHPSDPYGCQAFCQLLTAKVMQVVKEYELAGDLQ